MSASFDATPLTAPVDPAAVRAFRQAQPKTTGSTVAKVIGAVVVCVLLFVFYIPLFIAVVAELFGAGQSPVVLIMGIPILVLSALAIPLAIRGARMAGVRAYRLSLFARANGMTYAGSIAEPALPGMIFSVGSSRTATDAVRGDVPRFVEFANYRYTTGSGKSRTTHRWGYVAIKLDVPLPHIVLDALGNNGLFGASNLPASFDTDQRLSLEGDFDRHFSLSCPQGYERDALYLFTPDIMARFIDNAAALDVEIIDDWLFLYAKRDFSTLDPATWAWLFSVVGALLDKLSQWSRWRDDHWAAGTGTAPDAAAASGSIAASVPFVPPVEQLRPPPGVAAGGRRLKRRVPWSAIVLLVIVGLMWVFFQSGVIGALLR